MGAPDGEWAIDTLTFAASVMEPPSATEEEALPPDAR
jgi:hypothetical protein